MAVNALLRVTQINAIYFDKEIFSVFKQLIQDCLKHLPPGIASKYDAEVNLLLRLAILRYSIFNHDSTFGQKLLSIKYETLTMKHKSMFVATHLYNYLQEKFEVNYPSHKINKYFTSAGMLIKFLNLVNISLFLRYGQKPLLIDRFLGLTQIYSKDTRMRHYDDKYMTRELIWNGFIEALVYLLPLINYHKVTRILRQFNPLHVKPKVDESMRKLTVETKCPHCNASPIMPCHMGCTHIFCYTCLKGNQNADSKYECPVCEYCSENVMCEKVYAD